MKRIVRAVPNTITALNLFTGCIAIVFALRGWTDFAVYCIFAAAVFDFCDGLSARLLKAYSNLGKQLDSLADMVSFGIAPAALLHNKLNMLLSDKITGGFDSGLVWELWTFFPFIMAVFSALRLAKFNIDTRQNNSFIGLPTPANALLTGVLVSLSVHGHWLAAWMEQWYSIIILSITLSALLVCNLPMFALKFKNLRWSENKIPFVFILLCLLIVCCALIFRQGILFAIAVIFFTYIFLSFILSLFRKK
ncbi:MAG: CDP-alcohol phosphatidyltransferase family protein [Prevotellaceae bacterium]|jgi:CDP-diacylglycerol--serine O-phosphatidyltransferase|nr:CDP-alcohol phosphatidyltransferase family protein [Prevotellaceae bacterium]